jgi:hypothetical protein
VDGVQHQVEPGASRYDQHLAVARLLLRRGANPEIVSEYHYFPQHEAAGEDAVEFIEALVNAGATFNRPNSTGYTPLHLACRKGHSAVVDFYLERGADRNVVDEFGASPLHEACDVGSYCSMFSGQDILEKLRDGVSRESVALGCINSIADRVIEIGRFTDPVFVTGGVAEYFPGVLTAIAKKTGNRVEAIPQPILAGAVGAGLWVFQEKSHSLSQQGAN